MKLKLFLDVTKSIVSKKKRNELINKLNDEYDDSLTYIDIEDISCLAAQASRSSAIVVLLGFLSYLSVRNLNYRKKKSIVAVSLLFGIIEVISNIISDTCDKIVDDSEYDYGCDIEMFMHDDDDDDDELIPDSVDKDIADDFDSRSREYDRNDLEDGDIAIGADSYI